MLQDFLAPELRAVDAKFSALDEKLEAQAKVQEARHHEVMARIDVTNDRIDGLKTSLDLDKRVERLETRRNQ